MQDQQRLIDANKLYNEIENNYKVTSGDIHKTQREFLDAICDQPTIDAEPIRHGSWVSHKSGGVLCSVCGTSGAVHWHRCPMCESKMDGKLELNTLKEGELPF